MRVFFSLPKDCDEFTRNFLQKLGVRVPAPLECPPDPYTTLRDQVRTMTQLLNTAKFTYMTCLYFSTPATGVYAAPEAV